MQPLETHSPSSTTPLRRCLIPLPSSAPPLQAPPSLDNYFIRNLLGESVFNLPVGQLTPLHTAAAEKLLSSIDLIVDMDMPGVQDEALRYGAGWQYTLKDEYSRAGTWKPVEDKKDKKGGKGKGGGRRRLWAMSEGEQEGGASKQGVMELKLWRKVSAELAEANSGDEQLYQTARALAALDAVVFNYAHRAGVVAGPTERCGHIGMQLQEVTMAHDAAMMP
jgi:hypothetical protein